MKSCILLLILCIKVLFSTCATTDAGNCDSNKCYHNVNKSHKNLLDLIKRFNSTSSSAKITKPYDVDKFKQDINELNKIENEVKKMTTKLKNSRTKLNQIETDKSNARNVIDRIFEKLANISQFNVTASHIITEAKQHQSKFITLVELGQNASKTCQQAHNKYAEFENIIKSLVTKYNDVTKIYNTTAKKTEDTNKNIKQTFEETVKIKTEFDQLELPFNFIEDYIMSAEINFNKTVAHLQDNSNLLKELLKGSYENWNEQVRKNGEEVKRNISDILDDVKQMNEELAKYEKAFISTDDFTPTVDDESIRLLNNMKKKVTDLEEKFKAFDFSDEDKKLLNDDKDDKKYLEELKKRRLQLKEYNLLLDVIPYSEEKLKEIDMQIKTLRVTILLFKKLEYLKEDLERLRKNRDEIVKINCTTGPTGILV